MSAPPDAPPQPAPALRVLPAAGRLTAVVLVLPGGKANSVRPADERQLSYRRMVPIAEALHGDFANLGDRGAAVWLLRYRLRGWNGRRADALTDARWAIARIRRQHPGVPIVL
ncbi:MAG: alpha/beta hydrolase, partial [Thermocrispum sp.]